MRSHLRTIIVLALAAGLVGLFLYKVDLLRVAAEIARARPEWLALSLATMIVNLAIRAFRWQYLLEPLGHTTFARAFRATAVGFAANSVLPARAGEVIRPYFLARTDRAHGRMSATGAFATIILERLLDVITVLVLLASYVFVFGRDLRLTNPVAVTWLKGIGGMAAAVAFGALAILFVLAGDPARLGRATERLARVVPSFAAVIARVAEKSRCGDVNLFNATDAVETDIADGRKIEKIDITLYGRFQFRFGMLEDGRTSRLPDRAIFSYRAVTRKFLQSTGPSLHFLHIRPNYFAGGFPSRCPKFAMSAL